MIILSVFLCCSPSLESPEGYLVVSQEQQASWSRNFNPFLASGISRWPTTAGIYEPMMIYSQLQGTYIPWLATKYEWNEDATQITFTIRDGIQWSDGTPLEPHDIVYSFTLMKEYPALDGRGLWSSIDSVTSKEQQVVFTFAKPFASGLDALAHQAIIPEHEWSKIEDPVGFANPSPIASGPYTEILHFGGQMWDLGQNPYYWQDLSKSPKALRFPAFPSNEQAALALLQGEVDWAGNFLPAIDRIYVERNPEHHAYWFPLVGTSILLYPNHTDPLLGNTNVRKALSYAINREKVVQIAMHNYTKPAPVTGLSPAYGTWDSPTEDWTRFDLDRSKEIFRKEQFSYSSDGRLLDPKGNPVSLTISVVSGWSDWVRAAQVISQQLSHLGIQTRVEGRDFGAWFSSLQKGEFQLSLGWSTEGPTAQSFYGDLMSAEKTKPIGEIIQTLQHRFIERAPAIPLFLNPSWGECNKKRFVGWPSFENPYARLSPNNPPETLLVMTKVRTR